MNVVVQVLSNGLILYTGCLESEQIPVAGDYYRYGDVVYMVHRREWDNVFLSLLIVVSPCC